ncbi:MAG: hypothetical protein EOO48_02425 [Flavobacterium sp.]|nr:MAG: hypothetical protein EOO48_02425 [Flavobacterium sp.]
MKQYSQIIYLFLAAVAAFLLHFGIFYATGYNQTAATFYYSLISVYGFFLLCSAAIVFVLIGISKKNLDNTGYTFLLLTIGKMGAAYAFLYPAIQESGVNLKAEKINFFVVFAFFLAVETMITIRILNRR